MPRFTLIAEHYDDNGNVTSKVTHEFEEDFLNDVLMHMQEFLRGTGYYFDGELGFVEPEQYMATSIGPGPSSTAVDDQHSGWYFDTSRNR